MGKITWKYEFASCVSKVDVKYKTLNLFEVQGFKFCGERGIRTPGPLTRSTVFKTAAFDHSAISPNAVAKVEQFFLIAKAFAKYYNKIIFKKTSAKGCFFESELGI